VSELSTIWFKLLIDLHIIWYIYALTWTLNLNLNSVLVGNK